MVFTKTSLIVPNFIKLVDTHANAWNFTMEMLFLIHLTVHLSYERHHTSFFVDDNKFTLKIVC